VGTLKVRLGSITVFLLTACTSGAVAQRQVITIVDPNLPAGDQTDYPPTDPSLVASPPIDGHDAGDGGAGSDAQDAAVGLGEDAANDAEVVD
jgi:hypothetical protein